jgi:hypothetical protein
MHVMSPNSFDICLSVVQTSLFVASRHTDTILLNTCYLPPLQLCDFLPAGYALPRDFMHEKELVRMLASCSTLASDSTTA